MAFWTEIDDSFALDWHHQYNGSRFRPYMKYLNDDNYTSSCTSEKLNCGAIVDGKRSKGIPVAKTDVLVLELKEQLETQRQEMMEQIASLQRKIDAIADALRVVPDYAIVPDVTEQISSIENPDIFDQKVESQNDTPPPLETVDENAADKATLTEQEPKWRWW